MNNFSYVIGPSGAVSYQPLIGTTPAGHVGEHNALTLNFTVNSSFCPDASYYRVAFGSFISDELYADENNAVAYTVPQTLTQGKLLTFQLTAYAVDDGVLTGVVKSDIISLELNESHRGTESVSGEPVDAITTLTLAAQTAAENAAASATAAAGSAATAQGAASTAVLAASSAASKASDAETSAGSAATSATAAAGYATASQTAASSAAASSSSASGSASAAEASADSAASSASTAQSAASNSVNAASSAANKASNAENAASSAAASASAAAGSASVAAGYAVDSVEVENGGIVVNYHSGSSVTVAQLSDILSDAGVKSCTEATYTVSTPIWTLQPTLTAGSADALIAAPAEFYYLHRVSPLGTFQLYKVKGDSTSVVKDSNDTILTFTCSTSYYTTGNDGLVYEGDAIEIASVSPSVVFRRAGVTSITCPLMLADTYSVSPADIRISVSGGLLAGNNLRTTLLAANTDPASAIECQYEQGTFIKSFNNSGNTRSDLSIDVDSTFFTQKYRSVVGRYDIDASSSGWATRYALTFNQCANSNMIIPAADVPTCTLMFDRVQTGYISGRTTSLGEQLKTVNVSVNGASRCLRNGFTVKIREMG